MKKQTLFFFACFLACFVPVLAYGQTQVAPFLNPKIQLLDNSGLPCVGCLLNTYQAGTTTPLATYSDSAGSVPNANPVVLDSAGRATVYLTSASYKFVLTTSLGVTIWTQDNITWNTIATTLNSLGVNGNLTVTTSTAATGGANQSGPLMKICGNAWNGSSSIADCWSFQDVLGTGSNPTSTLTLAHSGSSGTVSISLGTVNVAAGGLTLTQPSNGADVITATRATDTLPVTGNFVNFKTLAGVSVFKVDVLGNLSASALSTTGANADTSKTFPFNTVPWSMRVGSLQGGAGFIAQGVTKTGTNNSYIAATGGCVNGVNHSIVEFETNGTIKLLWQTCQADGTVLSPSTMMSYDTVGNFSFAGAVNSTAVNSVQYASSLTSIPTAYANGSSTGVTVMALEDLTINTGQTLTVATGKPVTVDLATHKLIISVASGVGLTVTTQNVNDRQNVKIKNGTIVCSGAGAGVTALKFSTITNFTLENVNTTGCNGTGQLGVLTDNAEDGLLLQDGFLNNTQGLQAQNASNNVTCSNCRFNGNVLAWEVLDTSGFQFTNETLTQSNTGTCGGKVIATGASITNFAYDNSWLENNGDATTNARHICFQAATGKSISGIQLRNNRSNSVNGSTTAFEFDGPGAISSTDTSGTTGVVAFATSGLPAGTTPGISFFGSNFSGNFDIGLHGIQTGTGAAMPGIGFNSSLGSTCWEQEQGVSGFNNGSFLFINCTSNFYSSGTVIGNLTTTGMTWASHPVVFSIGSGTASMTTAAIASGACGTTVTVAASGVATTDTINIARNAAVTAPNGLLTLNAWPTSGNVNFNYCNPTAASQTPGAATLNWSVTRAIQ